MLRKWLHFRHIFWGRNHIATGIATDVATDIATTSQPASQPTSQPTSQPHRNRHRNRHRNLHRNHIATGTATDIATDIATGSQPASQPTSQPTSQPHRNRHATTSQLLSQTPLQPTSLGKPRKRASDKRHWWPRDFQPCLVQAWHMCGMRVQMRAGFVGGVARSCPAPAELRGVSLRRFSRGER